MMLKKMSRALISTRKARLAIIVISLLALFTFSGCSSSLSTDQQSASQDGINQANRPATQADIKNLEDRIEDLNKRKPALEEDRNNKEKTFNDFKRDCQKDEKQEYKRGIGCKETEKREAIFLVADESLKQLNGQISEAERRLAEAKAGQRGNINVNVNANTSAQPGPGSSTNDLLQTMFLGLLLLTVPTLLFIINSLMKTEMSEANRQLNLIFQRLDKQITLYEKASTEISAIKNTLSSLQNDVRNMSKIPTGTQTADIESRPFAEASPDAEDFDISFSQPRSLFPSTVEKLHEELAGVGRIVDFDFTKGSFVEDDDGHYLLGRDLSPPYSWYIVPRSKKFQSQNDYFTHYSKYYECQRPGGGEVTIIRPATVTPVDGGWQIENIGKLEVN